MSTLRAWDLIAAYLAVRRTGSLSAAARSLSLSQPTLRRRIAALESQLGVVLFSRGGTVLSPAPGTDDLLTLATQMDATAASFVRRARADGGPVPVRISCSEVFATEIMPGILADLHRARPEILPELSVTNRVEDILRRDADVAVRLARPRQEALICRRVRPLEIGLYAAPGALADRFHGLGYAAFQPVGAFIADDRAEVTAHGFRAVGLDPPATVVLRCDNLPAQLSALRAGIGAAPCPVRIAEAWGLVRLCPELSFELETWVVMHEDLGQAAAVRAVFDALVAALL